MERTAISNIYNYDLDRGTLARITFARNSIVALWNVKGDRIVYGTLDGGIYSVNANGLCNTESLFSDPLNDSFPILTSFSPDGSELLYTQVTILSSQDSEIFSLSMSPEGETRELFANDFFGTAASVSPDGRWIAYQSNESGSLQIHVRPYPATDTDRWQVSIDGGGDPKWSADGTHLFFRKVLDAEGRMSAMYSVSLEAGEVFKAGQPSVLFTSDHLTQDLFKINGYAVAGDGERFLMLKPAADQSKATANTPTSVVLIQNFADELKRLVPESSP